MTKGLAVVRRIEVVGTKRDAAADVQKFLDVAPGTPCGRDLLDVLKTRLSESGRYLNVTVTSERAPGPIVDGCKSHDITIQLREYAEAAPIAAKLPPAEQALLKLGQWVDRWARGETDEDIVMTAASVIDGVPLAANNQPLAARTLFQKINCDWRFAWLCALGAARRCRLASRGGTAGRFWNPYTSPARAKSCSHLRFGASSSCRFLPMIGFPFEITGNEAPADKLGNDRHPFRINAGS